MKITYGGKYEKNKFLATLLIGTLALSSISVLANGNETEINSEAAETYKIFFEERNIPEEMYSVMTFYEQQSVYNQTNAYNLSDDKVLIMVEDHYYGRTGSRNTSKNEKVYTLNEDGDSVDEDGNIYVPPYKNYTPDMFNNNMSRYFSGSPIEDIQPTDNSGVHWKVTGETGYNEATAFITLPTVSNVNYIDRPYMYFGVYGGYNYTNICGDYGVVYMPTTGNWDIFRYAKVWDDVNKVYTPPKGESNMWAAKTLGSFNGGKRLYLQVTINYATTNDSVRVQVRDADTWNIIGDITTNFASDVFNSNLSNVRLLRETNIAQGGDEPLDITTGTLMQNAKFGDVYIYSPTSTNVWSAYQTTQVSKVGKTKAAIDTITANIYSMWDSDNVTIYFKK